MAGYFQQPAILWPWREGGANKRGAPTPCPRRPAPPTSLWRAIVAGYLHPQTRHTIRQREAVLRSEPCVPSAPSRPCPPFRAERSATALHNGSPLRTRTALRSGHARLYATGGWRLIRTERAAADNTVVPSKLPSSAPSRPCPPFRAERSAAALHNGSPLRTRTALRFGRLGGSPKAPAPLPLPRGRASRSPLLLRVAFAGCFIRSSFAGCFCGLLISRPSWFLPLSLASALRAAVRSFGRLWFSGWGFGKITSPC